MQTHYIVLYSDVIVVQKWFNLVHILKITDLKHHEKDVYIYIIIKTET